MALDHPYSNHSTLSLFPRESSLPIFANQCYCTLCDYREHSELCKSSLQIPKQLGFCWCPKNKHIPDKQHVSDFILESLCIKTHCPPKSCNPVSGWGLSTIKTNKRCALWMYKKGSHKVSAGGNQRADWLKRLPQRKRELCWSPPENFNSKFC